MKKSILACLLLITFSLNWEKADAQCSICTRTAQQMGEKPARGLNTGIMYLAATPFAIAGVIAFRFFRKKKTPQP